MREDFKNRKAKPPKKRKKPRKEVAKHISEEESSEDLTEVDDYISRASLETCRNFYQENGFSDS